MIRCGSCKRDLPPDDFPPSMRVGGSYAIRYSRHTCRSCISNDRTAYRTNPANKPAIQARSASHRHRSKLEIIDKYGGKCSCCGESELVFLVIDHVNGGMGGKNRHYSEMGLHLYRRLLKEERSDEYRVLCHNCNFAEHVLELGCCPHRAGVLI